MEKPIIVTHPNVSPASVRPGEYYVDANKVMWHRNRNDVRPRWTRISSRRQTLLLTAAGEMPEDYGVF